MPSAASCGEQVSECVGVDGSTDRSLIQAGVSEGDVDPVTGECRPGHSFAWAWWEVLPAMSQPVPTVPVAPGDELTVSVWEVSGDQWGTQVTDDSTGTSFGLAPRYGGPASSAEWVVEAPRRHILEADASSWTTASRFPGLAHRRLRGTCR